MNNTKSRFSDISKFSIVPMILLMSFASCSDRNDQGEMGQDSEQHVQNSVPENLGKMFDVPGLSSNPEEVDWRNLPQYESQHSVVYVGVENQTAFNHHPFIVYWDGRFMALWNDGYVGEDEPGQRVRYAISQDALEWSEPIDLTGRNEERRYTASGFWIRDGEMYALASLRDSNADEAVETGKDPLLLAYKWNSSQDEFDEPEVMAVDYFAQNIPQKLPNGEWMILGKGGGADGQFSWGPMKAAIGGVESIDDWTIVDLPGAGTLEEAEWYPLPNGHVVAHFRTRGERPLYLARTYSVDNGRTWIGPIVTDFPESGARHHGLRLSNGLYALLVNPNPNVRIPFSIALSKDGLVYDRIANVIAEETSRRWDGRAKGAGYHYMRGFEHEGKLYTIYTVNKEDVEVSIIPLSEFEKLYEE